MPLATLSIVDLLLRAVIGDDEWERDVKQDVLINVSFTFDASRAVASDALADTINYKQLKRKIIADVENSRHRLIEKLAARILVLVMEDPRVTNATVRVDKPQALRYAKSVAVEMSEKRG